MTAFIPATSDVVTTMRSVSFVTDQRPTTLAQGDISGCTGSSFHVAPQNGLVTVSKTKPQKILRTVPPGTRSLSSASALGSTLHKCGGADYSFLSFAD